MSLAPKEHLVLVPSSEAPLRKPDLRTPNLNGLNTHQRLQIYGITPLPMINPYPLCGLGLPTFRNLKELSPTRLGGQSRARAQPRIYFCFLSAGPGPNSGRTLPILLRDQSSLCKKARDRLETGSF